MTKFFAVNLGVLALLAVSGLVSLVASTGELADPTGALSVTLPAGSSSSPSYRVASIGLKGEAVFRGQVKQSTGNDVVFHRVPDLLDPSKSSAPFRQGMLATQKPARPLFWTATNRFLKSTSFLSGPVTFPRRRFTSTCPRRGMIPPWIMSWPSFPRRSMQVPVW